jgi:hypothetical protein
MKLAPSNIVVIAAGIIVCLAGISSASPIMLQPGENSGRDVSVLSYFGALSYAVNADSGTVYGVDQALYFGVSYIKIALPVFAKPATVVSAELGVYAYDVTVTADHSLYEVLDPWTEPPFSPTGEVTGVWDPFPEVNPTPVDTVSATAGQPGWLVWDVTSLVSSWTNGPNANNGVMIATEGGAILFWASEYQGAPTLRPYLKITYTPEPATLSLLALGGLAILRRRRKRYDPIASKPLAV